MPTRAGRRTSLGRTGLLAIGVLVGCPAAEGNPGFDPTPNEISFPSGLLLDPRVSAEPTGVVCEVDEDCGTGELCTSAKECRPTARWLFVTNANSDRRTNAGSLMALDLDGFFRAAFDDPGEILDDSASISPDPDWATNSPVCGSASGDGRWCRRVANLPQVVECLEEPFVCSEQTIHFGNFPGPTAAWVQTPGDDEATLLIPVRGDPSITYAEVSGGLGGSNDLAFECGQADDADGSRRCDDAHRLRFLRNDPDSPRLSREPFRILVTTEPGRPLAYVSHQGDNDISLFALDGLTAGDGSTPAMVHQAGLLGLSGALSTFQGGFGLAQRPCDVATDNAPSSTLGCTRPLVYAAMRWQAQVRTLTAINHELDVCSNPDAFELLEDSLKNGYCEAQVEPVRSLSVGELSTANVQLSAARPILADIGFSRDGNELYVVQSNPGGLLRVDTSIGADGETRDVPAGQVEICAQPTSMAIYDDGGSQFALVTCYRSGEVFIVDLASFTVVGLSRAGIGPDSLAIDLAREVVYVANSLDGTISIIDMSRSRPTRFNQIARIGLQEPYVQ
jgi:DNA-binding beta-propeller fold protein YncE